MRDPDTITEDVPEGDAADQATPTDPTEQSNGPADDDLAEIAVPLTAEVEADPADVWEQSLPAPGLDEDDGYEHTI